MSIFDQVSNDIKAAMLAKDKVKLEALRNAKKYFLEAKTAPGADDLLTDEAALKILQKLVKQGRESARIYTEQHRADLAEAELEQVKALEGYLCAYIGMPQKYTYRFIVAITFYTTSSKTVSKSMKFELGNFQFTQKFLVIVTISSRFGWLRFVRGVGAAGPRGLRLFEAARPPEA